MGGEQDPTTDTEVVSELTSNFSETVGALFSAGSVRDTLEQVVGLAVSTIEGCDYAGIFLLENGELAVTLLRAIGLLSRNVHPYRDDPAGPQLETPTAQCLGPAEVSLAVMPHDGSWLDADLVAAAERYRHPVVHRPGSGDVDVRPSQVEGLSIQGPGVAMTSLRRRGEWLEVRLVAESPLATTAVVGTTDAPVTAARRCDLLGRDGDTLPLEDGVLTLPLRPWQIVTVQLRTAGMALTR